MEQIQNTTLYIWHDRQKPIEVNDDSLKFIMGAAGAQPVLDYIRLRKEFNAGYGIMVYESPEFYARHQPSSVTEELKMQGPFKVGATNAVRPGFPSTILLEERLKELDLDMPDHEIFFNLPKGQYSGELPIDKIKGIAGWFGMIGYGVLLTNGTDIENGMLIASPKIEGKINKEKSED